MKTRIGCAFVALALSLSCEGSLPPRDDVLAFAIQEGKTENRFFRRGDVAAHLLATAGDGPRIVVAFPAGNTGAGMWFDGTAAALRVEGELAGVERADRMRGVTARVRARAARLGVKTAILGSIRALREHGEESKPLPGLESVVTNESIVLRRVTLDGSHRVELSLEIIEGTAELGADGRAVLSPGMSGEIVARVTALSDEEPLTPLPIDSILTAEAAPDPALRSALAFLAYEQKILAGSWQYLTYFGRDTLLSTRLLMPVLQPNTIEAALGSVIERLAADGEVAHEENVGEWASVEPSNDYKMVDDDFMLAPVLSAYVESAPGKARAEGFFARRTTRGRTFAEMVRRNLDRVLAKASAFAMTPTYENLVRIGDGMSVGDWRDSEEGLGGGQFPYDVNAALVPAALRAAGRLYALDAFGTDRPAAEHASELAEAWSEAEPLFRVTVDEEEARRRLATYGVEQGFDVSDALASIDGPVTFPALSLDANGAPVPIEHSDEGFVMMFGEPSADWLASAAHRIARPFPAGLRTPVGMVVANPAYATTAALREMFTRDHYHGTVIWSWQQALLLSGLRRQMARLDLDAETVRALTAAERSLTRVIEATKAQRTSELWSFSVDEGGFHVVPFGQRKGHRTEANAVQLWSTVYLALDHR